VGGIGLDLGKDARIILRIFVRGLSFASFSRKAKTAFAFAGNAFRNGAWIETADASLSCSCAMVPQSRPGSRPPRLRR
jgi:hypothetical protein